MPTCQQVPLHPAARAYFTGRDATAPGVPIGAPCNLAHRRPHRPGDLARARRTVAAATGTDATAWHLMQQVHGAGVAVVDDTVPPGTELRAVDGMVTALPGRALVVQVADCIPVLLANDGGVGVAHAGRAGVVVGVAAATVAALRRLTGQAQVRAALGPAIGPCCYEVPTRLQAEVAAAVEDRTPGAGSLVVATTTWGTPSLDLPGAVLAQLAAEGAEIAAGRAACTHCEPGQFSHRRDPDAGRQVGLVVRTEDVR